MTMTESEIIAPALSWRTGAEDLKREFKNTPNFTAAALQADAIEACASRLEAIAAEKRIT